VKNNNYYYYYYHHHHLSAHTFIIQRSVSSRLSSGAPGSLGTAYSSYLSKLQVPFFVASLLWLFLLIALLIYSTGVLMRKERNRILTSHIACLGGLASSHWRDALRNG